MFWSIKDHLTILVVVVALVSVVVIVCHHEGELNANYPKMSVFTHTFREKIAINLSRFTHKFGKKIAINL